MKLNEYIKELLIEIGECGPNEIPDTCSVLIDVGVDENLFVDHNSANRIKFTITVKRK